MYLDIYVLYLYVYALVSDTEIHLLFTSPS